MRPGDRVPPDRPVQVGVLMSPGLARDMVVSALRDDPGIAFHDLMHRGEMEAFPLSSLDVIVMGAPGVHVPADEPSSAAALHVFAVDVEGGRARVLHVTGQQLVREPSPASLAAAVRRLGNADRDPGI